MTTEYRRPGVYVEETLLTGSNDTGNASTTFLLVGAAPQGRSTDPVLVESWQDFVAEFGPLGTKVQFETGGEEGLVPVRNYLPYAAYSFFQNGGRRLFVQRSFSSSAGSGGDTAKVEVFGGQRTASVNLTLTGASAPTSGTGNDGDVYVSTGATKRIYGPKVGGAWGSANALLGSGNSTATVLTGTVAPDDVDDGTNGDFYVNVAADLLYGPKAAGAWPTTTTEYLDAANASDVAFVVAAKSAGEWGNALSVRTINDGELDGDGDNAGIYSLQVLLNNRVVETFSNISVSGEVSGTYRIDEVVNDDQFGSKYIKIVHETDPDTYVRGIVEPIVPVDTAGAGLDYTNLVLTDLSGGVDPAAPSSTDLATSVAAALDKIEGAVIFGVAGYLNYDGDYVGIDGDIDPDLFNRGDVVYIDDYAQPRVPGTTSTDYKDELMSGLGSRNLGSSFVAAYAPWIIIPNVSKRGATITVPPAGGVMGVIARTDATDSVFRAPAGIDAVITNAVGVDAKFGVEQDLGELNAKGVNVIRPMTGRGICVMGARTRKRYDADRYLSARRTLIYLRERLRTSTEFAIFENNDGVLWQRLTGTAERILRAAWSAGGLRGNSPSDAYFIVCDNTNNTPATIAAGEVRMDVGVALQYPAEFIMIRLTQFEQGGSLIEIQPAQ